ncbi:MarR family winged helix-turn-helix transcriptional regulator [Streptomyces mirabilis]|uniref:MarR family winged helix-turn-helix transcriptional regulator n=1 Tax=Streptomyces mirabilis TaxID=68239 RepID=UPI00365CAACF
MPTATSFTDVPLHLLRRALQRYTAVWNREVPELTAPQYAVLIALAGASDSDQTALAHSTGVDRATMTPLLDRLAGHGYVQRVSDPRNRRRKVIQLTEEGQELLARIAPAAERAHNWAYDTVGEEGVRTLMPLLRTLAGLDA